MATEKNRTKNIFGTHLICNGYKKVIFIDGKQVGTTTAASPNKH